jgi:CheY-like chemotaxis protein
LARRILLADDSVTAQNMGRRILSDAGYEVVTVNNGSAALKKIAENKPDIIVLDVYMPGYGGLEVCQRVKEAAETARIPVLLTVGKLEPFRPEEARRVKADAFIIKPFEATELLTALTKLEDKIVAGPLPQKSGRFARALAAVEGADFGDKETGWKNRLSIPGPNAKAAQAENDAPETMASPVRDLEPSEPARLAEATPEFERPIPAGLPADITPEEIAAITAAAASFDGKAGNPVVIAEGSASESATAMQAASAETIAVQPSEPGTPAATLASAAELEAEASAPTSTQAEPAAVEAVSETAVVNETPREENSPAATELPAPVVEAVSAPPSTEEEAATSAAQPSEAQPSAGDAEVMAAIASLAPANGSGSDSVTPTSSTSETNQEVAVAVNSAVAAEASITGPRWIAESVAVTPEESTASLEQEMEQAAAAIIAVEAARNDLAVAPVADIPTPDSVVSEAEAVSAEVSTVADAVSAPEPVASPVAEISAPIEISASEVSTIDASAVEVSPSEVSATEISSNIQNEEPVAASKEESAFAAAASAGSASEPTSSVEAISQAAVVPEISESAAVARVEATPQREAELAAAWQNWKQIRESFVSTPSVPVAETSAAEASSPPEEATAPVEANEAEVEDEVEDEVAEVETVSSEAPGESKVIASIVDTMLAELRPKLVEEIAKKMNSEKKEKQKEKEKEKKKKR